MADYSTAGNVIPTSKVHGTDVYNLSGEKLGSIDDVLLNKINGRATHAILAFGGFLGMDKNHYPLPWSALQYSPELKGYLIDIDKDRLQDAPNFDPETDFVWTPEYAEEVDVYYGNPVPPPL